MKQLMNILVYYCISLNFYEFSTNLQSDIQLLNYMLIIGLLITLIHQSELNLYSYYQHQLTT